MSYVEWSEKYGIDEKAISRILTSKVLSINRETPVMKAVSMMHSNQASCLVITNENKPIGIFTEKDIVKIFNNGDSEKENAPIEAVMSKPVLTANDDIDIYEAYELLIQNNIRHLIIVDPSQRVLGIVTQSDIIKSLSMGYFIELKGILRVMTSRVITIKKDQPLIDALSKMSERSISCLVVEEDNKPVGIITSRDISRLFKFGKEAKYLKIESAMTAPVYKITQNTSLFEASGIMNSNNIRRLVIEDEEGCICGIITESDIIKVLEEKYTQSIKRMIGRIKTDILSNVSHELKTPLTIIKSSVQLARDKDSNEEQEKLHLLALKAVERLNNIVEDLVTAANRQGGMKEQNSSYLDLREALPIFIDDLKSEALERNVVVETYIEEELPQALANPYAIKRAFQNILGNAIKFSKDDGGEIFVKVGKEDEVIKISIIDSGIGIPSDKLDEIFTPLYQIDASTKRKYQGTGMGLAVAKSIVENSGGATWVESSMGEGTKVHFTLPIAD